MISIIVQRAPADFQGADISDPLIATEAQAQARGRAEIDKKSTNRVQLSGVCPVRAYMQPGSVSLVSDLQQGQYPAMLRSFSLTIDRQKDGKFKATTNIVQEREP